MTRMVEKRASTVDEAVAAALVELGVDRNDVDVEVVSEAKRGLFGGGRRAAHVRVTARESSSNGERAVGDGEAAMTPVDTSSTDDGRTTADDRPATDGAADDTAPDVDPSSEPATAGDDVTSDGAEAVEDVDDDVDDVEDVDGVDDDQRRVEELNEEADLAADFVEGLLDILELPGDIEIEVDESHAFVNVVDVGSGLLIGRRGATLDALQELVRAATQRQVERRSHVRVDIEGYRQRQLEKLKDRCRDGIAQVRETGEPYRLEPMDAYERKVMHDVVARTGGVESASEGVEPRRRVVIQPAE